jgi:hypothetical protein
MWEAMKYPFYDIVPQAIKVISPRPDYETLFIIYFSLIMVRIYSLANDAERRSGRKPGARVLIPPGYLHPGKGTH